jgi:SAM-dependent methyltransferase
VSNESTSARPAHDDNETADTRRASARGHLGRAGFESGSDVYERARPSYPSEAVDLLMETAGLAPGSRVLDLAAGTGKMTRQLVERGLVCLAAEPSPSMREVFTRVVPGVPLVGATAEQIPLADATVDAVVVAQAFHWFDPPTALAEVARVLRPDGWLVLIWNERDETVPVVRDLVRISKWDTMAPYPIGKDFGADIDRSGRFGTVQRTKLPFTQWMDLPTFVGQVDSRSYVQILPDADRRALLDEVEAFGGGLPQPIAMPYITDLFCARLTP